MINTDDNASNETESEHKNQDVAKEGNASTPSTPTAPSSSQPPPSQEEKQEAFLIRKASDAPPTGHCHSRGGSTSNSGSMSFFRDLGGAPSSSSSSFPVSLGLSTSSRGAADVDTGPGKLVEGLGLDARRYIERLLSLNR